MTDTRLLPEPGSLTPHPGHPDTEGLPGHPDTRLLREPGCLTGHPGHPGHPDTEQLPGQPDIARTLKGHWTRTSMPVVSSSRDTREPGLSTTTTTLGKKITPKKIIPAVVSIQGPGRPVIPVVPVMREARRSKLRRR